ncbi:MAG: hypothetical protein Q8K81_07735 [Sulfuricurvum sp.]|nr:hypothetical protein [Sulfuricurvum sp.]
MHVSQECFLSNTEPFQQPYENSIFKITVEDETLLGKNETIKEISLWGDGKIYRIKTDEEHVYREDTKTPDRKSKQLFGDEIKAVSNAKFVKLLVKYQENVKEEQSSNGTSSYYTTIKTTVAKEKFFPIILNRPEIDNALFECSNTFSEEKNRQSFVEILIGIGLLAGLIGISVIIIRFRRGLKK